MAISADIVLAVSISKPLPPPPPHGNARIRIANVDRKFLSREFEVTWEGGVEIDATVHEWSNYFKAGMQGALEFMRDNSIGPVADRGLVGMDVLVSGTVPAGAGLSSSAAFVCASALAVLVANGVTEVKKADLVGLAIVSERYVGVNSGGYIIPPTPLSYYNSLLTRWDIYIAWIKVQVYTEWKAARFI